MSLFAGSGAHELEVPDGEPVHPEEIAAVDALDGCQVLQVRVLGIFEIVQYGACGDDAGGHVFDTKSFEGMGLKVFEQVFGSELFFEKPAIRRIGKELAAEDLFEMFLKAALEDDLGGLQGLEEFVGVFGIAFRHEELARGNVEKGETDARF